jgi:hypothetical protein
MNESTIAGVSVRAIIVLFLVVIFAITIFTSVKNDALNSLVMAAIGWYFGQKSPQSHNNDVEVSDNTPPKIS